MLKKLETDPEVVRSVWSWRGEIGSMKYQSFPEVKSRVMRILALLLVAVVSACGGGNDAPDLIEPPAWEARNLASGTWAVMGSSTAAGAGATFGKGWADLLQLDFAGSATGLGNIAKGGAVTYEGLSVSATPLQERPLPDPAANIDRALSLDPVLLLVSYPSNDTGVGYAADETVNNILAIRTLALAHSVPVIVLSSQPRNDFSAAKLAKLVQIDERLASAVGPCFVAVRSLLADGGGKLAAQYSYDGVHPNDEGHLLIATQVRALLESGSCVILPAG